MKKTTIVEIISGLFILLFLYAGISKLTDYNLFAYQTGFSPLIRPYAKYIAIILPAVEILTSFFFFFSKTKMISLYSSFVLMTIFTIYISWMLLSGLSLPCTCGGVISKMSWSQHLIFNIFFLLLSIVGIILQKKQKRPAFKASNALQ